MSLMAGLVVWLARQRVGVQGGVQAGYTRVVKAAAEKRRAQKKLNLTESDGIWPNLAESSRNQAGIRPESGLI